MSDNIHTYSYTVCPQCKADLTQPNSVKVEGAFDDGTPAGTALTRFDSDGVLQFDEARIVAAGFHSGTQCNACGETLDDLEII